MHIKAGYEIAYDCPGPTPMLLVLSIHPSRVPDLVTPHRISFDREVVPYDYVDGFGNVCTRIVAPPGRTTIRTEFVISDSGLADIVAPDARSRRRIIQLGQRERLRQQRSSALSNPASAA